MFPAVATAVMSLFLWVQSTSGLGVGMLNRRGFAQKAALATAVTGSALVLNKVFIVNGGPGPPYQPPPNSLSDKTILITGGNTGLGAESARRLAQGGAKVIITSRSLEKGEATASKIREETNNADVFVLPLDLTDIESVKKFDRVFIDKFGKDAKLDILLNNAGVMAIPDRTLTVDGFEAQFATNHLGHFALTQRLFPFMKRGSRVINVSSSAHMFARNGIDFSDVAKREKSYAPWTAYGDSKLANILFTNELNKRSLKSGTDVSAYSLHPGVVRTELGRYLINPDSVNNNNAAAIGLKFLFLGPSMLFTKDVAHGATTQVTLSSFSNEINGSGESSYYSNSQPVKLEKFATDEVAADELWNLSEKLTDLKFLSTEQASAGTVQ